jgi:hypothetical protein
MVYLGVGAGARGAGSRNLHVSAAIIAAGGAVPATRGVGFGSVQHFFEFDHLAVPSRCPRALRWLRGPADGQSRAWSEFEGETPNAQPPACRTAKHTATIVDSNPSQSTPLRFDGNPCNQPRLGVVWWVRHCQTSQVHAPDKRQTPNGPSVSHSAPHVQAARRRSPPCPGALRRGCRTALGAPKEVWARRRTRNPPAARVASRGLPDVNHGLSYF